VLWVELRRGSALATGLSVLVLGGILLYIHMFYAYWVGIQQWVGRWGPLAASIRTILAILIPLVVAGAAWQGGRERRRRIDDQLLSTPRPLWQRTLGSWAAITLGAIAGLLMLWLSAVLFVAPIATYSGGGWWWTLAIAFLSLASAAAVGLAVGRLIPFRFVAPVAAVLAYFYVEALTIPGMQPASLIWLSPSNLTWLVELETHHLESSLHIQQTLWIGGGGAAALVLAGARRKWLALFPAMIALVGMIMIVTGSGPERWQADPVAQELVCAGTAPEVCVTRVNAFLLDELVPVVHQYMARWGGVEGVPGRVVDGMWRDPFDPALPPHDTVEFYLGDYFGWNGRLANHDRGGLGTQLAGAILARPACDLVDEENLDNESTDPWAGIPASREEAGTVALGWAVEDPTAGSPGYDEQGGHRIDPAPNPATTRLLELPDEEQKRWISRYLTAAAICDDQLFDVLVAELR
jgi:hypothetical protein